MTGKMQRCVITGAADGIGRALALRYAAAGYAIVGIDIDAVRAEQTRAELAAVAPAGDVQFVLADLSDPAVSEEVLDAVGGSVEVFIHNAGINHVAPFARSDLALQQQVIDVNFLAPLLLTAGALRRGMLAAGSTLVYLSSLSHFVSYPGATVYAATKDGVAAYARSLAVALAAEEVHVLTVFPGPTRTAHAHRYSPDNSREARRMPPEQLAELIFQAVVERKRLLIPGAGLQLFARLGRLAPGITSGMMKRAIYNRLK